PTPLAFKDAETIDVAHRQIAAATKLIGRPIRAADDAILRHYHNRGILPFEIATNLSADEYDAAKAHLPPEMTLRGVYLRAYPQGKVAGQIVGYCGRTGGNPDGIIDNHETIWPQTEGREGIEQTFNAMLTGFRGYHAHVVHPSPQGRPSRLPSASRHWKAARLLPASNINVSHRSRLVT